MDTTNSLRDGAYHGKMGQQINWYRDLTSDFKENLQRYSNVSYQKPKSIGTLAKCITDTTI